MPSATFLIHLNLYRIPNNYQSHYTLHSLLHFWLLDHFDTIYNLIKSQSLSPFHNAKDTTLTLLLIYHIPYILFLCVSPHNNIYITPLNTHEILLFMETIHTDHHSNNEIYNVYN